jgi:hypothetical protein
MVKCESPCTPGYVKLLCISEPGISFSVARSNSNIDLGAAANGMNNSFEENLQSCNEANQSRSSPTEFCNQIFGLPMVPILWLSLKPYKLTNQIKDRGSS